MARKKPLQPRAPRNRIVLAAIRRKAGAHQKSHAALRRRDNQRLKSQLTDE
jgi:hypothetical protein